MESISVSNARRTPAANILTTNSTIPLFCRLLWTQILNFVTVDVGAYGKKAMVEFSDIQLCIRAWKHEV